MGICKLCLKKRPLMLSHFMPKAAFRSLRGVLTKNPNPTMVMRDAMVRTSYQLTDRVLCGDCEGRFDRLGERWVLPRTAAKTRFPLLETVRNAPVDQDIPGATLHRCEGVSGIDVEKLTYFAMSIFWRAATHHWKQKVSRLELGPYEEKIRAWLLGDASFPKDMSLIVTLASENKDIFTIVAPVPVQTSPYHGFIFYVPGIEFLLCVGKEVSPTMRKFCVYTMADHPIGISTGVVIRLKSIVDKFISDGAGLIKLDAWLEREKKFERTKSL